MNLSEGSVVTVYPAEAGWRVVWADDATGRLWADPVAMWAVAVVGAAGAAGGGEVGLGLRTKVRPVVRALCSLRVLHEEPEAYRDPGLVALLAPGQDCDLTETEDRWRAAGRTDADAAAWVDRELGDLGWEAGERDE